MNFIQKNKAWIVSGLSVVTAPAVAFAQTTTTVASGSYCTGFTGSINIGSGTLTTVIKFITCFLLEAIVPLLFALAIGAFIYGVFDFIRASANGEETGEKKQFMVWGIIALSVMLSVWGLVHIFQSTFGIGDFIPQLPVNGQ